MYTLLIAKMMLMALTCFDGKIRKRLGNMLTAVRPQSRGAVGSKNLLLLQLQHLGLKFPRTAVLLADIATKKSWKERSVRILFLLTIRHIITSNWQLILSLLMWTINFIKANIIELDYLLMDIYIYIYKYYSSVSLLYWLIVCSFSAQPSEDKSTVLHYL